MVHLAVYGTLRFGYRNHLTLSKHGAWLVGGAWVYDHVLLNEGWFPRAVALTGGRIYCEVYDVPLLCIKDTDKIEGVEHGFYERVRVATPWGMAFMYRSREVGIRMEDLWYPDGVWRGEQGAGAVPWTGFVNESRLLKEYSRQESIPAAQASQIELLLAAQNRERPSTSVIPVPDNYQPPPRQQVVESTSNISFKGVSIQIEIPWSKATTNEPFDPDAIFDKKRANYGRRDLILPDIRRALVNIPDKETQYA